MKSLKEMTEIELKALVFDMSEDINRITINIKIVRVELEGRIKKDSSSIVNEPIIVKENEEKSDTPETKE